MQVAPAEDKLREARLHWYGYVQQRPESYIGGVALAMMVHRKQPRGRTQTRYTKQITEDLRETNLHDSQS